jgi:WW domain-containing oxidoreductase
MPNSSSLAIPFAGRSTADDVLSGVDLAGKTILITGCNSGIGFETMRALQAHGAHAIALARSEQSARDAIARAGGSGTPVACDLADLASVDAAIGKIHGLGRQLDAVIANAGVMGASQAEQLYGVEKQFWVNHVAHFRLVNGLLDLVPNRTARIVVVSSLASKLSAPKEGIAFGDLDGRKNYSATRFYAQSKLANALFARELSQRLAERGIAVNSLHPGSILGTGFLRNAAAPIRLLLRLARPLGKTLPQGAATQTLLAASPLVAGVTGLYWSDCKPAKGSPHLEHAELRERLWTVTEDVLTRAQRAIMT